MRVIIEVQFDGLSEQEAFEKRLELNKGILELVERIQPENRTVQFTETSDTVYLDPVHLEV